MTVYADDRWRLTGANLRRTLEDNDPKTFFAVVATAGTTNFGIVDDLASVAEVCAEFGIWFHVDGAYGGAALAAPSARPLFDGVERADSFIVDPHKWLFAPFDCCALIYREPALARAAHTQHAGYLDVLTDAPDWNPTDYSVGLTRRARGPAALVLPRGPRHRGLLAGGRAHPRGGPVRRGRDPPARAAGAAARARPVGDGLPPDRLGARGLPGVVRPAARPRSSPSSCRRRTRGDA